MTPPPRIIDQLVAIFETERRLLLEGRYAQLGSLQDDKEALLAQFERSAPNVAVTERLRMLAAANLGLLSAARDGFSAAQARVRELERLARGGASYDQHGARLYGPTGSRTMRRV